MRTAVRLMTAFCVLTIAHFATIAGAQENALTTTNPSLLNDEPTASAYRATLKVSLSGRSFDDEVVNARYSRSVISFDGHAAFFKFLEGRLAVSQYFTNGASSNLYGVSEVTAGMNALLLDEVSLTLKPVPQVWLTGGVLQFKGLNPVSSIMGEENWMAGSLTAEQNLGDFTVGANATQGTPSSLNSSDRVIDQNTLPLFTAGNVRGEYRLGDTGVAVDAAASHFEFTDLSSASAMDSQKTGGSVIGNGKGAYEFVYNYRGWEYGGLVKKTFSNLNEIAIAASSLVNEQAPSRQNSGGQVKLLGVWTKSRYRVTGELNRFHIEADSLPAAYGPLFLGLTNRDGGNLSLKVEDTRRKIAAFASYTMADVADRTVLSSQFQGDRRIVVFGAEARHDFF